jgi:hypothetical protein
VGGGSATLSQVAFHPARSSRPLAAESIDQIVGGGGGPHNVVVLAPDTLTDTSQLATKYHINPILTTTAAHAPSNSTHTLLVGVAHSHVAPTSTAQVLIANGQLEQEPLSGRPMMGSLVRKGLYEVNLAYDFNPSAQAALLSAFGGLVESTAVPSHGPGSSVLILKPWEQELWSPTQPGAISRNEILSSWGHRANVVLADGVENQGFIPAVIGLNAR